MPAYCRATYKNPFATNIRGAFVLGIIGMVFHLIFCVIWSIMTAISHPKGYGAYIGYGGVAIGIVYSLISAILIYGARARNQTAILVWICFAILECIGLFIFTIAVCVGFGIDFDENDENDENGSMIFIIFILLTIGIIIFEILTIIVALFARKEI